MPFRSLSKCLHAGRVCVGRKWPEGGSVNTRAAQCKGAVTHLKLAVNSFSCSSETPIVFLSRRNDWSSQSYLHLHLPPSLPPLSLYPLHPSPLFPSIPSIPPLTLLVSDAPDYVASSSPSGPAGPTAVPDSLSCAPCTWKNKCTSVHHSILQYTTVYRTPQYITVHHSKRSLWYPLVVKDERLFYLCSQLFHLPQCLLPHGNVPRQPFHHLQLALQRPCAVHQHCPVGQRATGQDNMSVRSVM